MAAHNSSLRGNSWGLLRSINVCCGWISSIMNEKHKILWELVENHWVMAQDCRELWICIIYYMMLQILCSQMYVCLKQATSKALHSLLANDLIRMDDLQWISDEIKFSNIRRTMKLKINKQPAVQPLFNEVILLSSLEASGISIHMWGYCSIFM